MIVLAEREEHAIGFPDIFFRSAKPQKRESKLLSRESPSMKYFPGETVMASNVRVAWREGQLHNETATLNLRQATRANAKGSMNRGPLRDWWSEE